MGGYSALLTAAAVTLFIIFAQISYCEAATCKPSITKASGPHAPTGKKCAGKLIFKDDFNKLDLEKWQHESTLQGGGVSFYHLLSLNF